MFSAALAVAFEAYLEPSGGQEQYQEVLLNDTRVTYTDRWAMVKM
jgi:hypothetical protein